MRRPVELLSRVIASIAFVGRAGGPVKTLAGFTKSHHTLPDAANAVTNAFLGKICAGELADEAEKFFQEVRAGLGYKRRDGVVSLTSPLAVLTARDFTLEIFYALEERDAARYAVTTTLRGVRDAELAKREEFTRIFVGKFTEISFALEKGARVEAVIDAIEGLDGEGGLSVRYPSDYSDCAIRVDGVDGVDGVDAEVRCTGATLELLFPRAGSPAELIAAFAAVREAFQISKGLSGLIA